MLIVISLLYNYRQQFYMHLKQEFLESRLMMLTEKESVDIAALMAQVELGDFRTSQDTTCPTYQYAMFVPSSESETSDFVTRVSHRHSDLTGIVTESAKYKMIQLISSLDSYGVEYHQVKNSSGQAFHMGVGPEGIRLYDMEWKTAKR